MGACTFQDRAKGKTASQAFADAVAESCYQNGHGGYSGTLAEKSDFVMIAIPNDYVSAFDDKEDGLSTLGSY